MSMKKKPIADATHNELVDYAKTVLGLEIKNGTQTGHVLAKIRQAQPDITEILYVEQPASAPVPVAAQPIARTNEALIAETEAKVAVSGELGTGPEHDPMVMIQIPKTGEPGGDRDVPVSVNGRQWILQRDRKIEVPLRVVEAMQSAMQTLYEQKQGGSAVERPETVSRDVLSYNFNILRYPSEPEIAAWRARTDAAFNP